MKGALDKVWLKFEGRPFPSLRHRKEGNGLPSNLIQTSMDSPSLVPFHAASIEIFFARASSATGALRVNKPFLNSALTLSASIFLGK